MSSLPFQTPQADPLDSKGKGIKRSFNNAFDPFDHQPDSTSHALTKNESKPADVYNHIPGGFSDYYDPVRRESSNSTNPNSKQNALDTTNQDIDHDDDLKMSSEESETAVDKVGVFARTLVACATSAFDSVVSSVGAVVNFIDTTYKEQKNEQRNKRRRIGNLTPRAKIPGKYPSPILKSNTSEKHHIPFHASPQKLVSSSSAVSDLLYHRDTPTKPSSNTLSTHRQLEKDSFKPKSLRSAPDSSKNNLFTFKSSIRTNPHANPFSQSLSTISNPADPTKLNQLVPYDQNNQLASLNSEKEKKAEIDEFLEGMRKYRLGGIHRPQTPLKSHYNYQYHLPSPYLQRSPNTGAPLMTKVGGGGIFSQQVPSTPFDRYNINGGRLFNSPSSNLIEKRGFLLPSPSNILVSPNVMKAFKFDERKLASRRPITTYRYAWYHKHPKIELPEQPVSTDIYAQTYLRIIEQRDREQSAIEKLREEQDNLARIKEEEDAKLAAADIIRPLDADELEEVYDIWAITNPRHTVADAFKIQVTTHDIWTLRHGHWLNDNIIDFYLAMVTERSRSNETKLPKSFVFTSHFYTKLEESGFDGVKRWAKRKGLDVTKVDYIFVPVNRNNVHWCLAVINNKDCRFEFYDSMNGRGTVTLSNLRDYMYKQTLMTYPDSNPDELGYDSYEMLDTIPCPQQQNDFDCGVFTCKMVEVLSRDKPLSFSQKDMRTIRERMVYEILHQSFLNF